MQIVVPMSGTGQRFLAAGYSRPKPLIEVEGRPIIAHVVDMFPGESNFLFICNEEHLEQTNMAGVLADIAPSGRIVSIPAHKLGPVYAVSRAFDFISDDSEVIVNYCDFGKAWDYAGFLSDLRGNSADGGISAYTGFHPHMLGTTNYAFMRHEKMWMQQIQEKQPFTDDRMSEYASDGTYYFRTGAILKQYFRLLMERGLDLNGEYYVSMVYNLLVEAGLSVRLFPIETMLQWGTPADLEEYQYWSHLFRLIAREAGRPAPPPSSQINLIPLAGRGSRFANEGYELPKPLIPVDEQPMVVHAARSLPPATEHVFVCLAEHLAKFPLEGALKRAFPDARIVSIGEVTEGQAVTVGLGLRKQDADLPLLIGASDNGMIYDHAEFLRATQDPTVDGIVFTCVGLPGAARQPHMYGWVRHESGTVTGVSVKQPISDNPAADDAIVGCFYFRTVRTYERVLSELTARNIRVNNEFYVDSMIGLAAEMGLKIVVLRVEAYLCWGTPDEYRTYLYWQRFFAGVEWHPYTGPRP